MTPAEREELERMRKCYQLMPSEIPRLIELERKDAAEKDREGVMEFIRGASERLRASGSAIETWMAQIFDTANRQIRNL